MAFSEVIEFKGSPDLLVWKHPVENFNTTSQLIVDPTYEALFVSNGYAADLFGEGRHTLETQNIPILRKILQIPTGGKTPFPCKVYYINKVHQMDLLWGTKDAIPLEDPLYKIFLHVMIHGSLSYSISDSRKFLLKLAGLRDQFTPEMMVSRFRGIVMKYVKDLVAKIMINGQLSYFMVSANLMEISDALQEKLSVIFDDYGITLEFFNVEAISVSKADYEAVTRAKERASSRLIEGYTWKEEREMMIAEKFAGNTGAMGAIGGIMGGAMGGMIMGNSIAEIARNAMKAADPAGMTAGSPLPGTGGAGLAGMNNGFNVNAFLNGNASQAAPAPTVNTIVQNAPVVPQNEPPVQNPAPAPQMVAPSQAAPAQNNQAGGKQFCTNCGAELVPGAKFCFECGNKVAVANKCPGCGSDIQPGMKFCFECGRALS